MDKFISLSYVPLPFYLLYMWYLYTEGDEEVGHCL